ncbi:hypothetical protein SAMN06265337_0635 [Hymenobacter gelipurpurascens]|uniref:Uncharacterized protein n=1 Tax=Hymenobacter gelipurpurascens TaxID=89968 RepID=A0A212T8Z4_9BACT|nr:hypothetical protein [Hymenobacter gelipurpurascens]SNC62264.1 hypothetical protein SAMN06265337_0635 [Hymenobacter gelipurpurascens]
MLTELLALVILVALSAATLMFCFAKWGWLQAWEVHGPTWFRRCDLCLGFWIGLFLCIAAIVLLGLPWWWVAGAFPSAALCRAVQAQVMG